MKAGLLGFFFYILQNRFLFRIFCFTVLACVNCGSACFPFSYLPIASFTVRIKGRSGLLSQAAPNF